MFPLNFTMTTLKTALLAATLVAGSGAAAFAHDLSDVSRAQTRQIEQIVQAWNSGQLTRREYNQLMAEQSRIAELQARAQYDGVTAREYHRIREAQTEAANHILTESHDAEINYWRAWKWKHRARF